MSDAVIVNNNVKSWSTLCDAGKKEKGRSHNNTVPICLFVFLQVGPTGSGKSSLVHTLAQLCGHKVVEFPVNSAMDTTDLVGGFVQVRTTYHKAAH